MFIAIKQSPENKKMILRKLAQIIDGNQIKEPYSFSSEDTYQVDAGNNWVCFINEAEEQFGFNDSIMIKGYEVRLNPRYDIHERYVSHILEVLNMRCGN